MRAAAVGLRRDDGLDTIGRAFHAPLGTIQWVMPVMIGQMLGPGLDGLILSYLPWRWTFFVNMPVGLLAIVFAWRVLPRDETVAPRRLDVMGFAMVSPGLALLLFGLVGAAPMDWRFSSSMRLPTRQSQRLLTPGLSGRWLV